MDQIGPAFTRFFTNTGLWNISGGRFLMVLIGLALVLTVVSRRRGSMLMAALGFGIIVGNMPTSPVGIHLNQNGVGDLLTLFSSLIGPEVLPSLVFLGIGALTDFSPLIANPRLAVLAGGAQIGIFAALVLGTLLGFLPGNASVAAVLGGGHAPLAIFASATLNPGVIGTAAIVAWFCARVAPSVVAPIAHALTTPAERRIRMAPPRPVSRKLRILFPVIAFIVCLAVVPAARSVLGMLFLGNLLRESGAARLSKTLGRTFTDVVTVLLAFGVGMMTFGGSFFSWATLGFFIVGLISLALAAAWGILMAKLMNAFGRHKINPLLGVAGVAIPPLGARIAHRLATQEDPENHLLHQAQAANLAGTIALALTIGICIAMLG